MADSKEQEDGMDIFEKALLPAAGAALGIFGGTRLGRKFAKKFPHDPKKGTFRYVRKGDDAGEGRRFGRGEAAFENAITAGMRHPRATLGTLGGVAGAAGGYAVTPSKKPRRKK